MAASASCGSRVRWPSLFWRRWFGPGPSAHRRTSCISAAPTIPSRARRSTRCSPPSCRQAAAQLVHRRRRGRAARARWPAGAGAAAGGGGGGGRAVGAAGRVHAPRVRGRPHRSDAGRGGGAAHRRAQRSRAALGAVAARGRARARDSRRARQAGGAAGRAGGRDRFSRRRPRRTA